MAGLTGLTLLPGAGGAVLGMDNDGTYNYEIVKIGYSAPGVQPTEVSLAAPLPVSIAAFAIALPLPAGASTAARQAAPGAAGTPSADVTSVQGVTGMTPVKTDGSGVVQPVSGTVAVSNFPSVPGQASSALSLSVVIAADQSPVSVKAETAIPVVNDPQGQPLVVTLAGSDINSIVNPVQVLGPVPVTGAFWQQTQPVSAPSPLPGNLSQIAGAAPSAVNPLPVQLSDGARFSDLASILSVLTAVEVANLRLAAGQFGAAGFIPIEIPSFLGA